MITVQKIYDYIQEKAPFETAEEWDNVGLLVGDRTAPVTTVVVALDITPKTIELAKEQGAQLIISHHPVIFEPLKALTTESIAYQLVKEGVAAICAHTNLDKAVGGVNDCLAQLLGLKKVVPAAEGMCRVGYLQQPMTGKAFSRYAAGRFGVPVRAHVGSEPIRTVAVCGGGGADFVLPLLDNVDAAVTGEIKHHLWLTVPSEKTVIEAGHYTTEVGVTQALSLWISQQFSALKVVVEPLCPPYQIIQE